MEAQEKLTQLKAQIAVVRDFKTTFIKHKAELHKLLWRPSYEHVSGNTLIRETTRLLAMIRNASKNLREARGKLNQLYFELGGEKGAKDLKCLVQKLDIEKVVEPTILTPILVPKEETEESSGPIVKVTGYLTVKEVRSLMETMLKFLTDRTTDSDKFGLEITGNGVTQELLIEHKEVV